MKMKLFASAISVLVVTGCSSTPDSVDITKDKLAADQIIADAAQQRADATLASLPDWVLNPPKSDNLGVYGVGIGESNKLDVSIKKSNLNAQFELAKSFGQALSGNEKSYTKDGSVKSVEDYTQIIDSLVDTVPINGYETVDRKMAVIDGKYTSYTLMRLSFQQFENGIAEAQQGTTDQNIKNEFNELYERLDKLKEKKIQQ